MDSSPEIEPGSASTSTTWLLIYTGIALFVVNQLYTYSYLWRKGIPGPMPLPLLGNYIEFLGGGFVGSFNRWTEKYGKNFGYYTGSTSNFITSDLELAKLILIKEFASFSDRDPGNIKIRYLSDGLQAQRGAHWKKARSYMSPAFSGSKVKQMIPSVNSCCDILMEVLDEKQRNGESFEVKNILSPFIMDCVARCAFGIQADCQRDPDDPFIKHGHTLVRGLSKRPGFIMAMLFPSLIPLMDFLGYTVMPSEPMNFFAATVRKTVEVRKEEGNSEKKDFLQLMIEAAETENDDQDSAKQESTSKKKDPLTIDELIGQSFGFFFAGYDTIASTLGMVIYCLSKNPEIQSRLQEEIDKNSPEGEPVGYDAIFKMEYLDMVWNETNRLFPVGFGLRRVCTKDFSYNGLHMSDGDIVMVNVWGIHHDPEHWPEPYKFDPERFTKEAKETRNPCTFLPFGAGPRNCVGMRFAVLEGKSALIRILQKYSFELTSETPDLSDVKNCGRVSLYPDKGIHFHLLPRN